MSKNGVVTHELNYVTSNRFYVEIDSQLTASFTECDGLGVQIKKEVIAEGGVNEQQRIILGPSEFSDVTLRRGVTDDPSFWNWISALLTQRSSGTGFQKHRRNVNILVFNQAGETMQCWTLIGAVPIGWKAPSLQAEASSVAIEELTLAYESMSTNFKSGGGGATILQGRDQTGYFGSS
ncbi:MAG: phage tail protein [Cyanobacteria bacterium P01_H01_bin.121]